jgi:hypothetical protein
MPDGHCAVVVWLVGVEAKVREGVCVTTTTRSVRAEVHVAHVAKLPVPPSVEMGYHDITQLVGAGPVPVPHQRGVGAEPLMNSSTLPPVTRPPPEIAFIPDGHCAVVEKLVGGELKVTVESERTSCAARPTVLKDVSATPISPIAAVVSIGVTAAAIAMVLVIDCEGDP